MRGYFPVLFIFVLCSTALALERGNAALRLRPSAPVPSAVSNAPASKTSKPEAVLEVKDGLVSANIRGESLGTVLSRLGQKAGFTFSIYPALLNKKITTNFSGLPLEKGLRRILTLAGAKNYRMIYGDKGQLVAVKVFGESKPSGSRNQTVQRGPRSRPGSRPGQLSEPTRISRPPAVSPAPPAPSGEETIPEELLQNPDEEEQPSGGPFPGGR